MDDNELMTAALTYARRRWAVLPLHHVQDGDCGCGDPNCSSAGKHPLGTLVPNGLKNATTDDQVIRAWWSEVPDANVAVRTGVDSGLAVLDIDPRHGGDKTLATLLDQYGGLPTTAEARTGGGGRHIFFEHPGRRVKIASKANALGPGVDVKGDGGYIVAPPSCHVTGTRYAWALDPAAVPLAPLPAWVIARLCGGRRHTGKKARGEFTLPQQIQEGARNDTLYRFARSMKAKGLSHDAVHQVVILENALRCVPPLSPDELSQLVTNAFAQPDTPEFSWEIVTRPATQPALPRILITEREFRDIVADGVAALLAANTPPSTFQRGGVLTRVRCDGVQNPCVEQLTHAALRGILARVADWRISSGKTEIPVAPPAHVVEDILAMAAWDEIPALRGLVEAPTFASDGTLVTTEGYHPATQLWFHSAPGFVVPPVVAAPSAEAVKEARACLLDDLLGDFPFDSEASRAHALVALLLPFVREMTPGPTPLHVIDAPTPGTGKGLLADVISIPATGRSAEVMSEGQDDEEWRKRITAVLLRAPVFVVIDNIARRVDSAALAAALTAPVWTDRILGKSAVATLPIRATWLATGNNIAVSNEMARRSVWIRVDARQDAPWRRTGFRHPKLRLWAQENRGRIVHACLTLAQAWIAAGRPAGSSMLGSFEAWAETMSGILDIAEVPGFLGNADQLYEQADEESQEGRTFVATWWQTHTSSRVGTEQLYQIALRLLEDGMLASVMGDGSERSQRTRLGKAVARLRDRVLGGYRVVAAGESGRNLRQYRLELAGPSLAKPA